MSTKSSRWMWFLGAAFALALILWLLNQTEWVNEPVQTWAQGEALHNEAYALQKTATGLGAQVHVAHDLDQLPPLGATLWLSSPYWDLEPQRERGLRRWVEAGGHLVLPTRLLSSGELSTWIAVKFADRDGSCTRDPLKVAPASPSPKSPAARPWWRGPAPTSPPPPGLAPLARRQRLDSGDECHAWVTQGNLPAPWPRPFYLACTPNGEPLRSAQAPHWALLSDERAPQVLEIGVGLGSVGVVQDEVMWSNSNLFKGENAYLAVQLLHIHDHQALWFVEDESRQAWLAWLWQRAWGLAGLAGLILIVMIKRGAVRFGPRLSVSAGTRRSMMQQVQGTGRFLQRYAPASLLMAQRRALDEVARVRLIQYAGQGRQARAQALAAATDLPLADLVRALEADPTISQRQLPATLALLETARRRLLKRTYPPATARGTPSSSST